MKKILFLTTVNSLDKRTGGEIATEEYLSVLNKICDVKTISFSRKGSGVNNDNKRISVEERAIESSSSKYLSLKWIAQSILFNRPYSAQKYFSKKYIKIVKELTEVEDIDFIIIDHAQLYWIRNYLIKFRGKIIFNSHNVEYKLYDELALTSKNVLLKYLYKRESKLMKKYELSLIKNTDKTWVLTKSDKLEYEKYDNTNKVSYFEIPGGFNNLSITDIKYDICMLGTWSWAANKKGLVWFLEDIYPRLDKNIKIAIAGKGTESFCEKYHNISFFGFVEDAQEFLSSSKVIVIPSIAGGGIQIKTLDAISIGVPLVTTEVGIRGIENLPKFVDVANSNNEFIQLIKNNLKAVSHEREEGLYWSQKRRESFFQKIYQELN